MADEQTTQTIDQGDAAAEAEADAFLASLPAPDGTEAEPAAKDGGPRRNATGQFQKKEPEATTEPEPEAQPAPTDTDEPSPDAVNPDDYRKALAALTRDGVPQSALDAMTPQAITAWGKRRAESQAEVDGYGKQLSELKKAQADETGDKPLSSIVTSGIEGLDELVGEHEEMFGAETGGPLRKLADLLVQKIEQRYAPMQDAITRQQREVVRKELDSRYNLSDESRWQRVLNYAGTDANEYATDGERLTAAARMTFADEALATADANKHSTHQDRANGQPATASRKPEAPAVTVADEETNLLNAIQDGRSDDAEKIGRRLGRRRNASAGEMMSRSVGG